MTSSVYSKLASRLSTMDGFPGWSDKMSENYFGDLQAVPDDIGQCMVKGVGQRFDERPSAKNLLDWARSLGPQRTFDIKQLDAPAYRPGSNRTLGCAALGAIAKNGITEKTKVPESARAVIRALEERHRAESQRGHASLNPLLPTGDFGLEYHWLDGKTERFPARHSEQEALRRRDEVCRKYSHFTCRVYQKISA